MLFQIKRFKREIEMKVKKMKAERLKPLFRDVSVYLISE